jgi:TRAP-type C4-dicarboxylate transport system permease small subunit
MNIDRRFNRCLEVLTATLLVLVVGLVSAQVVARYAFNAALSWSEEAARMTFVHLTFLGAALALGRRQNLKIDLIVGLLGRRARLWLDLWLHGLSLAFVVVVLAYSVPLLQRLYPTPTPALQWSMVTFYAGVPVGGLAMIGYLVRNIRAAVAGLRRGERFTTETAESAEG